MSSIKMGCCVSFAALSSDLVLFRMCLFALHLMASEAEKRKPLTASVDESLIQNEVDDADPVELQRDY